MKDKRKEVEKVVKEVEKTVKNNEKVVLEDLEENKDVVHNFDNFKNIQDRWNDTFSRGR